MRKALIGLVGFFAFVGICTVLVIATSTGTEPSPETDSPIEPLSTQSQEPTATPEPSPISEPTATPRPTATPGQDNQAMAVLAIQEYAEVRDAAINEEGDAYSLVLVVAGGTSTERAKELGDNFVRMVKSLGPDDSPGQEIGSGIYDYLIGICYPDGEQVALGAKAKISTQITW